MMGVKRNLGLQRRGDAAILRFQGGQAGGSAIQMPFPSHGLQFQGQAGQPAGTQVGA